MNAGVENPLLKVSHGLAQIDNLAKQPSVILSSIRKYSVNNTIPIAAVNAWLQFSLAYVVAIIITNNNLGFIKAVFDPKLMSVYALVSVILGAIFLTSLALKHMNRQEIKEEKSIDVEIRGGEPDEISEIAKNTLKMEIIPDLNIAGHKKESFSIVLPISKTQGEILKDQREENRNKVILLTIPYVISAAIIVGALVQNRFSLANVAGWEEWMFVALVGAIAIAGICIALSKSKSNKIDNDHNAVKKFDNLDILLPWRKGSIVSVLKGQAKDEEGNGPLSQVIGILRELKDEFINLFASRLDKLCEIVKKGVQGVENNFNDNVNKFLKEIKEHIKTLLDNLEEDIKQNVGEVKTTANKEITDCLRDIRESVDVSLKELRAELAAKLNQIQPRGVGSWLFALSPTANNGQSGATGGSNSDGSSESSGKDVYSECQTWTEKDRTEINKEINDIIQTKLGPIQEQLTALQSLIKENGSNSSRDSGLGSESSSNDSLNAQQDEEKVLDQELAELERERRIVEKQEKIDKLKKKLSEKKETKKWTEKLNGKPSKLFYSVLESKELEIVDTDGAKIETTLREIGSKMKVHYGNGEQKICDIKGNLQIVPGTKISFVDSNIQAAWEMACGSKSL